MKKRIAIITDSSSGFTNLQFPHLYVIPLIVTANIKDKNQLVETKIYHDGVDCDNQKITEMLLNPNIDLKTSQASLGECIELIEKIQNKYDEIYVIPITSTTSGSESTWNIAADEFKDKVIVVKQHMGGPMLKWIIKDFLTMVKNGTLNRESALEYANNYPNKVFASLIVCDIKQLAKGGRVGTFTSLILNAFKLNIIVSLDEKGMKAKGFAKNFNKCVNISFNYFKKHHKDFKVQDVEEVMFIRNKNETLKNDIDEAINHTLNLFKECDVKISYEVMPSVLITHAGNNSFIIAIKMK